MKLLNSLLVLCTLTSAGTQAFAVPDSARCHVLFREEKGLEVQIELIADPEKILQLQNLIETSNNTVKSPESVHGPSWRYAATDNSYVISQGMGELDLSFSQITFLNGTQLGESSCMVTGPSMTALFNTLSESSSAVVTKTVHEHGEVPTISVSVLSNKLRCLNNMYGSPLETPVCFFKK